MYRVLEFQVLGTGTKSFRRTMPHCYSYRINKTTPIRTSVLMIPICKVTSSCTGTSALAKHSLGLVLISFAMFFASFPNDTK